MIRGFALLVGLGAGAVLKQATNKMLADMPMVSRFFGLGSIAVGAFIGATAKGRNKKAIQFLGTGFVAYGILDLIISNVPQLAEYLPGISGPAAFMGNIDYGRSMYGANIGQGSVEIVGSSISQDVAPEIIGDDMDLADTLEMAI